MKNLLICTLFAVIFTLTACSTDKIPGVYRIDIQQGNDITQEMLSKLQPGMTKNQVIYVMGNPLLIDTFHDNRWDYIHSYQPGNSDREQRRITLYFDDKELLDHVEGDVKAAVKSAESDSPISEDKNVEVPLENRKTGIFQGLLNTIGLGDDKGQ